MVPPMKAKLLLLVSLLGLVLTSLCYVWTLNMAITLGEKVLAYLDAVTDLAQLY
jgi:hypothetical protein